MTIPPAAARSEPPLPPALMALVAVGGGLIIGAAATVGPAAAGAALAASVCGFYLLRHPVLAAAILVGAVPALSGLRRGLLVPGLRISEVLIGALAIAILVSVRRGQSPKWTSFDWLALAYATAVAVLGGIGLLLRGDDFDGEIGFLLGPFQFFLLYRAVRTAVRDDRGRTLALRIALLAAIPVCLITFVQVADIGGVRRLLFSITSEPGQTDLFARATSQGVGRATGPFVIWHTLSAYLWLISLVAVALLLRRDRRVLPPWVLMLVTAMSGAAILLTVSVTPVLALAAGMLWLGYSHRHLGRVLAVLAVAGVATALMLSSTIAARAEQQEAPVSAGKNAMVPETLSFRYEVWTEQYFPVIERNLLTGYGPGIPPGVTWESTESIYVTMLMRGGVPLLLLYLALMLSLFIHCRTVVREVDAPMAATVAEVVALAVVILLAYQAVVPLFMITGMPHLFWALAGLVPPLTSRSAANGSARAPRSSARRDDVPSVANHRPGRSIGVR